MTRDEAIAEIQRGLGFRSDRQDDIAAALRQAQRLLEQGKTLPWFLRKEVQALSGLQGANTLTLPSDFIRPVERSGGIRYQTSVNGGWVYLTRRVYDELIGAHYTSDQGLPNYYSLRATVLYLDRPLSQALTLYWDYYGKATVLSSNVENSWLANAPDLMIGAAGELMAESLRDKSAVEKFQKLRAFGWDALIKETAMRETADREIILGRNS